MNWGSKTNWGSKAFILESLGQDLSRQKKIITKLYQNTSAICIETSAHIIENVRIVELIKFYQISFMGGYKKQTHDIEQPCELEPFWVRDLCTYLLVVGSVYDEDTPEKASSREVFPITQV